MSVVESKLTRWRSGAALSQLDDWQLQMLTAFTHDLMVPAGCALATDGRWRFAFGVMWTGTADVLVGGDDLIAGFGPGMLLGEISQLKRTRRSAISLLENGRRSVRVITTSDAELTVIDHRAFESLKAEHPPLARARKRIASARSQEPARSLPTGR